MILPLLVSQPTERLIPSSTEQLAQLYRKAVVGLYKVLIDVISDTLAKFLPSLWQVM